MATDPPSSETDEDSFAVGSLPETIDSDNLEGLNRALEALFGHLRFARGLPAGKTNGRANAAVSLSAVCTFLMHFHPALAEGLHIPLHNLHGALLALNENNIEPMLRPTKRTGRSVSSPKRFDLIGIAIGSARRLEWTGMIPAAADREVATKLTALGIKPARGKGGITTRTLRGWRERAEEAGPLLRVLPRLLEQGISPEDLGWINAVRNAEMMLTEKWSTHIRALAVPDARRFILNALENSIRNLNLG
jgi:hypothetical protein